MTIPKEKPRDKEPEKGGGSSHAPGKSEDAALRAEMLALEEASIEDLVAFEQQLSDE